MGANDLVARVKVAIDALKALTQLIPRERFGDPPELENGRRAYELWLQIAGLVLDEQWRLELVGSGSAVRILPDDVGEFLAAIDELQLDLATLGSRLEQYDDSADSPSEKISIRHTRFTRDLARELVSGHSARHYTAEVLEWEIFQPEQWWHNAYFFDLRPALVGVDIPKQILTRLREIHRCVLCSNWFAAVALARSTLEFALRDVLEVSGHTRLENLVGRAEGMLGAELSQSARQIQRTGNQIVHPTTDADVYLENQRHARERVKEVVKGLTRIIEKLYSS